MILGRSGRIIADSVVFFLTVLAWLLVFIVPQSGDYQVFTGEPIQYALLGILLVIFVLSLLAGADRLSLRTVPVLLGLLLLDVICGRYIWKLASWLVSLTGHDIVLMVYLDTIGCVAAAILFGARMGVATASAYYLILSIWDPGMLLYSALNITVAYCAGRFRELGGISSLFTASVSGLFAGLLTALMAAPLNIRLFGPIIRSGEAPTGLLFNELKYTTVGLFFGAGGCDPLDKMLTFVLAFLLVMKALRPYLKKYNAPVLVGQQLHCGGDHKPE